MMKGGKEEEKLMGPMFPRLHVNDTEKGGPRAPPRNKMALYEQLSIPSQRFNSSAGKTSQPHNSKNMVLSASSSQDVGCERSMFSPLHISPTLPPQSTEKLHPSASEGINLNTNVPEFERKSTMNLNDKQPNFMGHFLPNQGCSLFRPLDNSALKTCQKEIGEEDDFRVPTFVHSRISQHRPLDKDRQTRFSTNYPGWTTITASSSPQKNVGPTCNSLIQHQNVCEKPQHQNVCEKPQHQNVCEKPLKRLNTMGIKLRYHGKDQIEQKTRETAVNKHSNSSSFHSCGEKIEEPSKYAEGSVDKEHPHGLANNCDNSCSPKTRLQHEGLNAEKSNIPMVKGESGSRASFGSRHISRNVAENCSVRSEDKVQESLQVGDEERNDDSETSMVDSISGLEISPDDVVGVIGQKHFWKARRAIVNQQRVFAVQVFELHRLIKVQKLIAGSPELLLGRYPYLASSQKVSCGKVLPSESLLKPQLLAIKEMEDSDKPSQTTECPSSNPIGKPSHPSIGSGFDKGHINQKSSCGPYSANAPRPLGPDSKVGQWCFPPPGNQWLVPVVSPSEGLIYKPYRGPCPPTGGFVAPVYGGYGPINLPPAAENFIGPPYGLQAPHHQQGGVIMPSAPNYFPPYGLPVMNPIMPTSTFEQMNRAGDPLMSTAQVEHFSEVNLNPHSRNSCNISNRGSIGPSNCIRKLPSSKGSEAHGSTASSPSYQQQGADHISGGRDPLPLFPVAPAAEGSDRTSPARSSGKKSRVIKVVPHNPRSATANESAARIFQSIQEERQHHDSH